jgi:aminopeptidase YwaD
MFEFPILRFPSLLLVAFAVGCDGTSDDGRIDGGDALDAHDADADSPADLSDDLPDDLSVEADAEADAGADVPAGCVFDGDPFDLGVLTERVTLLASPEFGGRLAGTPGDEMTRALIEERWRCLGLEPGGDDGTYQQAFVNEAGRSTANVVGILRGTEPSLADEIIVMGAHHDHFGVVGGELYPGADDNASGLVALLAVAQAILQRGTPPQRTIVFSAWGSEEGAPYFEGSQEFVAHPPAGFSITQVVYVGNFDEIGRYVAENQVYANGSFPGYPARQILESLLPAHPDLNVVLGSQGSLSDNRPFCDVGIPYIYFYNEDPECYHLPCDTADRIDYPHMAEIAAIMAEIIAGLADSPLDLSAVRDTLGCGNTY